MELYVQFQVIPIKRGTSPIHNGTIQIFDLSSRTENSVYIFHVQRDFQKF